MKPSPEALRFHQPLRGVSCAGIYSRADHDARLAREREKAAFERGRHEGEKALSEQLMRQRHELLELQQGVLQSLAEAVPRVARETEKVLVEIALEAACKLVAGFPISAPMVEAAVREAVAQVAEHTDFEVFLHPEDLAMLEQTENPLLHENSPPDRTRFKSAPHVTRGGCLVQTRYGMVDARRETKIAILRKTLLS